jgi:beta-carotene hydroxylase
VSQAVEIAARPDTSRSALDLPTAAVGVGMAVGLATVVALHATGHLPLLAGLVINTFLMNLSFTAWHEACHGNLSKRRAVNTAFGIATSFASIYPGYFTRRREHLCHHRYEGDAKQDPVYPRIQGSLLSFPFRLLRANHTAEMRVPIPASFLPMTPAQKWADRISNLLAFSLLGVGLATNTFASILWLWFVPRAIVFLAHAIYICHFPHAIPGGGYEVFRVRPSKLLATLTMNQNLHGVHHRWPSIPWHKYGAVLASIDPRGEGIEVTGRVGRD